MVSGKVVAGKYRLNQLLGTGGMAEVWSATNTFTDRQIAIKFMNAVVAKTPESAARFLKEAKVSARVNHPNIIDILDVGQTEEGQLFLVMELLTGFPLEVALRRQTPPMTIYEFCLVMVEVAQALGAAHKSGIVHRDLKPSNVFLHKVRDGLAIPKLLDFGVSKFLEEDQNHALTVAGTVLGSPLYMSPEQARGDSQIDGRTDVFAFGAILFEALCGYRAYEAKNFNALIVKIATSKPKSIDACAPHVPESLRRVVRKCLEVDLKARLQNFEEVVALLKAVLPELEGSPARLPIPMITATFDPDATNALPVLRASDRPPPASSDRLLAAALAPLASIPPGAVPLYPSTSPTGPSWHTPNTSYASVTVEKPKRRSTAMLGLGAAALVVVCMAAGIGVGWRSRGANNGAANVTPPPSAVTTTAASAPVVTAAPAESASADVQTVSVDSLPGAAPKPLGPVPHGSGRLNVSAAPGWCTLSIDGKGFGPTPLAGIDLPTGAHQLRCEAPNGRAKTASVTVQEGANSKVKFALDE
ncbi:Serine/threonine protein kinase [Labilithrix luteola]|uniref:Serine/threonine protein kinase n=1 Tax=Labilithrix luteola TaxID=1391654 RepID=A0A0K1QC37_9BACT|nr:serine/threonine-protein kinase [Labilithrix luteola]AKV03000.1 Serine/threonine protein kinase [Labilithrix luteola]